MITVYICIIYASAYGYTYTTSYEIPEFAYDVIVICMLVTAHTILNKFANTFICYKDMLFFVNILRQQKVDQLCFYGYFGSLIWQEQVIWKVYNGSLFSISLDSWWINFSICIIKTIVWNIKPYDITKFYLLYSLFVYMH